MPPLARTELAPGRCPLILLELPGIEIISTQGAQAMATFITTIKFTEKGIRRNSGNRHSGGGIQGGCEEDGR